jgi:pyrroline-5-carboxylate reductase
MEKLRVCFLGTGSMGSAVLTGLIASGHPLELISATTKSIISADALRARGISAMAIEEAADANALLAGDADLIVLGVKPYQIKDVLAEIKDEIAPNAVVISMAAGIKLASMAEVLPGNSNLIRTMPNTPALVGMGVTGVAPATSASADALSATMELFDSVGAALEITEEQIDALSAISGSGPAWVFYIMEQWEQIAQNHGFSKEQAAVMVRGTLAGSIDLLAQSDEELATLRSNVTSPGGTTERIIDTLEKADLQTIFESSLQAALQRAKEIGAS